MKRKTIFYLLPIGFYFMASCEQHTDYDQLKQENEELKIEVNELKENALKKVIPYPLSFFEKSTVKKGEMMRLGVYMGCSIKDSDVKFILKNPETNEYTDTLKTNSIGYAEKQFEANQIGKQTVEGIMIFNKGEKLVQLPFIHDYEVK